MGQSYDKYPPHSVLGITTQLETYQSDQYIKKSDKHLIKHFIFFILILQSSQPTISYLQLRLYHISLETHHRSNYHSTAYLQSSPGETESYLDIYKHPWIISVKEHLLVQYLHYQPWSLRPQISHHFRYGKGQNHHR